MNISSLFLNFDGVFKNIRNKPSDEGDVKQDKKRIPQLEKFKFTFFKCYCARETYWETVVTYPTSNLLEVKTIIDSEIEEISPVEGETHAFIVRVEKNKTTVLYCCFESGILAVAEEKKLWRLLPETLPIYRALFASTGRYLIEGSFLELEQTETQVTEICKREVLVRINANSLASLSVPNHREGKSNIGCLDEVTIIEPNHYSNMMSKRYLLDVMDFIINVFYLSQRVKQSLAEKFKLVLLFGGALLLSSLIMNSLVTSWKEDSYKEQISITKEDAGKSIKLANRLKKIKGDISKINEHLSNQTPKKHIFIALMNLVSEDNELVFTSINVSPSEILIRGTVKSATALLTQLSEVKGFGQVQFISPPSDAKALGERFNIKVVYQPIDNKDVGG